MWPTDLTNRRQDYRCRSLYLVHLTQPNKNDEHITGNKSVQQHPHRWDRSTEIRDGPRLTQTSITPGLSNQDSSGGKGKDGYGWLRSWINMWICIVQVKLWNTLTMCATSKHCCSGISLWSSAILSVRLLYPIQLAANPIVMYAKVFGPSSTTLTISGPISSQSKTSQGMKEQRLQTLMGSHSDLHNSLWIHGELFTKL